MGMSNVFIIAEHGDSVKSIERYFRFTTGAQVFTRSTPAPPKDQYRRWVPHTFSQLANWVESCTFQSGDERSLRNSIAIIDLCDKGLPTLSELNPIATNKGDWAAVVAMMVLTFPEMHWVFISPYEPETPDISAESYFLFSEAHLHGGHDLRRLNELHEAKFIPLFDPTGLRNIIRRSIYTTVDNEGYKVAPYVPTRKLVAAAVDDEEAYAYLNAYTAYRFGYRSHVVSSHEMMLKTLNDETCTVAGGPRFNVIFEDLYLNYPDKPRGMHISDLSIRDKEFCCISKAEYRVFITVGHRHSGDSSTKPNINDYRKRQRESGQRSAVLFKPLSGVFNLWQNSGLKEWLQKSYGNGGKALDYVWPPAPPKRNTRHDSDQTHSSPGRLLEIANRLIQRAQRIFEQARSIPEALHGALLALEALEYLGSRTPTTSLEALALKHKLETSAECMFYGVEYNQDMKSRSKEIEREVKSIGEWFRRETHKLSELNAEIGVLSALALKFREYNQFDEEQYCLIRIRSLHRRLWFKKNQWWAWSSYPFRLYVEFLLGPIWRLVFVIVLWITALSFVFGGLCNSSEKYGSAPHGFTDACSSFFGIQLPHELDKIDSGLVLAFGIVALVAGFVHLGIFISHLYSMISRR
jgi:hypothetical protein